MKAEVFARRWLVILLAALSIAATTAALAPHHDGDEPRCLLCKVGSQPLDDLAPSCDSAPVPRVLGSVSLESCDAELPRHPHPSAPRAPPI